MTSRKKISNRIQKKAFNKDSTHFLNSALTDLTQFTASQLEYWSAFQNYLIQEREKRKERILEALRETAILNFNEKSLTRIVDTRYQDRPLSSYGSVVVPPGGRFNFGKISDFNKTFQALYLASSFRTAASERFHKEQKSETRVDQESLDFRLDPTASFSSYRVAVESISVIDLRLKGALDPFVKVIAEIRPAHWITTLAKKLKQPNPATI